jgi:hypothetical protein
MNLEEALTRLEKRIDALKTTTDHDRAFRKGFAKWSESGFIAAGLKNSPIKGKNDIGRSETRAGSPNVSFFAEIGCEHPARIL